MTVIDPGDVSEDAERTAHQLRHLPVQTLSYVPLNWSARPLHALLDNGRDRTHGAVAGSGALIQRAIFQERSGWRRHTSKLRTTDTVESAEPDPVVNRHVSRTTANAPDTKTSLIVTS
jgi:hypothetical protein